MTETRPEWTPALVRAHADRAFAVLLDLWQHGDVPPVAILYAPHGEAVALPDLDQYGREELPKVVRTTAALIEAPYVLFACSASTVEVGDPDDMLRWQAQGRPLHEHPAAQDCLFATLDGPGVSLGIRATRDKDGNVCAEVMPGQIEGAMTNLSGRLGEN